MNKPTHSLMKLMTLTHQLIHPNTQFYIAIANVYGRYQMSVMRYSWEAEL